MKALFFGLGSIGQRHLINLLKLEPEIQLFAYRSKKNSLLIHKFGEYQVGSSLSEVFNLTEIFNIDKALEIKPDLIFITNPSSLHVECLEKSLKTNAKIFVEKPISHNLNNLRNLIINEEQNGVKKIAVGYQFRFHPAIIKTKKIINSGELGNIISANFYNGEYLPHWHPYEDYSLSYASNKKLGGGSLLTQIHEFDLVVNFFGLPNKIFAIGGHLSSLKIDVEDSVQVLMECDFNGKQFPVNVALNYLNWPPKKEFSIIGENGNIFCDLIQNKLIYNDRIKSICEKIEYEDFDRNDMFIEEIKNFYGFFKGNNSPEIDLKESVKSLEIAIKAKESIKLKDVLFL